MKQTKKTLFILFSAGLILALSSCHRGTGCPTFTTKAKFEQSKKKSV